MPKVLLIVLFTVILTGCSNNNWRSLSREPAGLAVNPKVYKDPVIEFYAADAYSWKGIFAVHSWIAIKERDAEEYTVFEVVGWRTRRGLPALREYKTPTPDRYWYGSKPDKFLSITGTEAELLIPRLKEAVARYPWANEYSVFPGPNSNTFPAWIGLQIPELKVDMPFRAIGSGYAD